MELSDLLPGVSGSSSGKLKFISGFRRQSAASLTITAPDGEKVILTSLASITSSGANINLIVDGITVVSNKNLTTAGGGSDATGKFWIGLGHDFLNYQSNACLVPPISGKSITITNIAGSTDISYSYLFVEDK